jgi:hypothetical protein
MTKTELQKIPIDDALRLATAYHEASHVVTAYVLDMECHGMELFEEGGGRSMIPPAAMFSNDDNPREPGVFIGYKPENAFVAAAGRIGHTRFYREYTGNPKSKPGKGHFTSDEKLFRKSATTRTLKLWARREAKRIVSDNWDLIEALACKLNESPGARLDRDQIEDALPRLMRAKERRLQEIEAASDGRLNAENVARLQREKGASSAVPCHALNVKTPVSGKDQQWIRRSSRAANPR